MAKHAFCPHTVTNQAKHLGITY